MRIRHLLLASLALAFLAPTALSQDLAAAPGLSAEEAPARFTYSGLLTAADGAPVADGPRALVFRGYASAEAAAAGGSPAWEEAHEAAVVGGRFLTVLGSRGEVPAEVRYMTVSVDGEAPSAPVRLGRGASAEAEFAPGNTLQDSYDNGRIIDVVSGPMQLRGGLGNVGLIVRDITPVFITSQLTRFRLTSTAGAGRIWEYRVYGDANPSRVQGTFSIADATGGGADGFIMEPGVGEDVLTLTGQTVQLGSVNNTAGLRAYTTPGTGGPGSGLVNHEIFDWFGYGGASRWYTEDGLTHTRLEPDVDGEGGWFAVVNGTGGLALTVDGNAGGGSMTTVGSGASSSSFNDTGSGTASVALPASSIDATEILNEGGAANANNSSPVGLSSGYNTTLTRSITAPTAGYVIAISTAELSTFHTSGTSSLLQYAVSRSCASPSAPPTTQEQNTNIPSSAPSGTYTDIMSVHGLFQVNAGTTTFCNVVQLIGSTNGSIDDQNLTLLFVPTAYGAISSNLTDEPGGREDANALAQAPLTAGDVEAERGASIQANEARVAAELAAIQARIAELQASMGNDR